MVRAISPVVAQTRGAFIERGGFVECLESRDSGAILSTIVLRMNSGTPVIVFMAVMPIELSIGIQWVDEELRHIAVCPGRRVGIFDKTFILCRGKD